MTFKDKLIKNISCRRFYSPTQLEYPSFGELETYQWGECTYSGAYPFTFRQPIKHKIAFKSTILYPFIP